MHHQLLCSPIGWLLACLYRSLHFMLAVLLLYSMWISPKCTGLDCDLGGAEGVMVAAVVIAVLTCGSFLVHAVGVVFKYPKVTAGGAVNWITAARAAVRFSLPSALSAVSAFWLALHSNWQCDGATTPIIVVGATHALGAVLVLVAVLFSGGGNTKKIVVRTAMFLAVWYVWHRCSSLAVRVVWLLVAVCVQRLLGGFRCSLSVGI